MTDTALDRDLQDFLAKVRRSNAGTEKSIEEAFRLRAEEGKLGRDRALSPRQLMLTMVVAGTGLFASGATIFKLFGH